MYLGVLASTDFSGVASVGVSIVVCVEWCVISRVLARKFG